MRYLLDLHKKRDLKTDNQESNNMVIAQNALLARFTQKRDLKTDNQEANNMVIAQNALLARFTQKEGSENWWIGNRRIWKLIIRKPIIWSLHKMRYLLD